MHGSQPVKEFFSSPFSSTRGTDDVDSVPVVGIGGISKSRMPLPPSLSQSFPLYLYIILSPRSEGFVL